MIKKPSEQEECTVKRGKNAFKLITNVNGKMDYSEEYSEMSTRKILLSSLTLLTASHS